MAHGIRVAANETARSDAMRSAISQAVAPAACRPG